MTNTETKNTVVNVSVDEQSNANWVSYVTETDAVHYGSSEPNTGGGEDNQPYFI